MRSVFRNAIIKEKSLGSNLRQVRTQLDDLTFEDPITVIALQQGVGKTTKFIDYVRNAWKKDEPEKIVFASPRHNHLNEVEKKLGKRQKPSIGVKHWVGFSKTDRYGNFRACSRLNNPNNNIVKALTGDNGYESLIRPHIVCDLLCGEDKPNCNYQTQFFPSDNVDLMPLEYLGTPPMLEQEPDIVFLDEAVDKITEYRYDEEIITDSVEIARNRDYTGLEENLDDLMPQPDDTPSSELLESIMDDIRELMSQCVEDDNFEDAGTLSNLENVIKYFEISNDLTQPFYYHPKIYDAFDLVFEHDAKVVFLNASFNQPLFRHFLKTYPNPEIGDIEIPKYTSNIRNYNSTIIRVYPRDNFYKSGIAANRWRAQAKIFDVIRRVEKFIPREKIGIITYQRIKIGENGEDKYYFWANYFRRKGYDTLHFWDESGLNILEDKYVLFLIGTPFLPADAIIEWWEKIHNEETDLEEEDIAGEYIGYDYDDLEIPRYRDEEGAGKLVQQHYSLYDVFERRGETYDISAIKQKVVSQIVDSIQRCRPLTHDRIIIAMGYVPEYRFRGERTYYGVHYPANNMVLIGHEMIDDDMDGWMETLEGMIQESALVTNTRIRELFDYVIDNRKYLNDGDMAWSKQLYDEHGNPNARLIRNIRAAIEGVE